MAAHLIGGATLVYYKTFLVTGIDACSQIICKCRLGADFRCCPIIRKMVELSQQRKRTTHSTLAG